MIGLLDDFVQSFRLMRRHPGFTVMATMLLGLGIGAATVLFSALDALLLRPLPVEDPDRIVRLARVRPGGIEALTDFRQEVYLALSQRAQNLTKVSAILDLNAAYQDGEQPQRVRVQAVSASYFSVFGVGAHLGRVLRSEDDEPGDETRAVVLSFDFWTRRYGRDPAILGRKVFLRGQPFVVVGVLPSGFSGASVDTSPDVRVSLPSVSFLTDENEVRRGMLWYELIARLRSGASLHAARDEANALFRGAMEAALTGQPDLDDRIREYELSGDFRLEPIPRGVSRLRKQHSNAAVFSLAAAGLLFTMLCANVSGLLLARCAARRHEFAVRLSIGASPGRLFRLAVVESFLLAVGGGLTGLGLAHMMLPVFVMSLPPVTLSDATTVPLALNIGLDLRVAAFATALSLLTAVAITLAPAVRAARTDPHSALRGVNTTRMNRGRSVLLAFQVALCTVLLVSAGLLMTTLRNFRELDPGFAKDRVVTFAMDLDLAGETAGQLRDGLKRMLAGVRSLPGVRHAAYSSRALLRGTGIKVTIAPAGQSPSPGDFMNTSIHVVSDGYFDTLGLQLLSGRGYDLADYESVPADSKPRPIVVNQAMSRRFFPGGSAVGKRFGITGRAPAKADFEIIGVVSDAKYRSLREPVPATVYQPLVLGKGTPDVLHVRTDVAPAAVISDIRRVLRGIDPRLPLTKVTTLGDDVEASLWSEKAVAVLAGAFGIFATLIVAAGLYALVSFVVSQRTREIGIRIAVGARTVHVLALVSRQTFPAAAAGVLMGVALSVPAAKAVQSLLFEVSATEPRLLTAAVLLVLAATVAASVIPTLRAIRIEPAVALRQDA
ncbi:MAG: ABC transporter permease [Acidobacteriota bacterium]